MKLTEQQLKEFKTLYKKHFNIELTDQDALELWLILVNHIKIILDNNF